MRGIKSMQKLQNCLFLVFNKTLRSEVDKPVECDVTKLRPKHAFAETRSNLRLNHQTRQDLAQFFPNLCRCLARAAFFFINFFFCYSYM